MRMLTRRNILLAGAATVLLACPAGAQEKLPVVASFSILGDLVARIGGDKVALTVLVGPDGDAHVFQPTPGDARAVAAAKVLVVNGLGFEGWMDRLVGAAAFKGTTVVASTGATMREMKADDHHGHGHGHGHSHGHKGKHGHATIRDPHAWQDLSNGKVYVRNIAQALSAADPANANVYAANATSLLAEIDALDRRVRAEVGALPASKRKVITSHDAFGHFGAAYGVTFLSAVGISTEAEASAGDVAKIVRQIRKEKVKAIFVENMTDPRLIEQIAKEAGARVGGKLYADSLSPAGGPAGSYIEMFGYNTRTLIAGMSAN